MRFIYKRMIKQKKKRCIRNYLRTYCNYKQNNWLKLLFMTTFIYNNNKHSNIDQTFQKNLFKYIANLKNEFAHNFQKEKSTSITKKQKCYVTTKYI